MASNDEQILPSNQEPMGHWSSCMGEMAGCLVGSVRESSITPDRELDGAGRILGVHDESLCSTRPLVKLEDQWSVASVKDLEFGVQQQRTFGKFT